MWKVCDIVVACHYSPSWNVNAFIGHGKHCLYAIEWVLIPIIIFCQVNGYCDRRRLCFLFIFDYCSFVCSYLFLLLFALYLLFLS